MHLAIRLNRPDLPGALDSFAADVILSDRPWLGLHRRARLVAYAVRVGLVSAIFWIVTAITSGFDR